MNVAEAENFGMHDDTPQEGITARLMTMWERRGCLNFVSEASKAVGGPCPSAGLIRPATKQKYSLMFPK
jgi:hypothetical protein